MYYEQRYPSSSLGHPGVLPALNHHFPPSSRLIDNPKNIHDCIPSRIKIENCNIRFTSYNSSFTHIPSHETNMALSAVNASINALVYQTKLDIVAAFKEFLLQETEIDNETLVTLLDKFKTEKISVADVAIAGQKGSKVPKAPKAEKAPKRARTAYSNFLSLQMKGLKASMAEAQAAWKQLKADNPAIAKDSKALLLKYQNPDAEDEAVEEAHTLPMDLIREANKDTASDDEDEDEEDEEEENEEEKIQESPPTKIKKTLPKARK